MTRGKIGRRAPQPAAPRAESTQLWLSNIAPLILDLAHSPLVPASTQTVAITARIVDEQSSGIGVTLYWRVDAATPPPFTGVSMADDGAHGDGAAADGIYGALIAAQPNNTVIEFYVEAVDAGGELPPGPGRLLLLPTALVLLAR